MRRFAKWSGLALAALIVASLFAVWTLTSTTAGSRWLLARAEPYLPEALEIGELEGSLRHGFVVRGFRWDDGHTVVTLRRAALAVDPLALFARRVRVLDLDAEGLAVSVSLEEGDEPQPPSPPSEEPFRLSLPLALSLIDARIADIDVAVGGTGRRIAELELAGRWSGARVAIEELAAAGDWLDADLTGRFLLEPPYRATLAADWRLRATPELELAGGGRIEGDWEAYSIEHTLDAPVEVETSGSVALAGGLRVALENRWRDVTWPLPGDAGLESAAGRLSVEGSPGDYRFELQAEAGLPAAGDVTLRAEGEGGLESVTLRRARLGGAAGRVTLEGEIGLLPAVAWDTDFTLEDFEPDRLIELTALPALDARLDARGSTRGELGERLRGALRIDEAAGTVDERAFSAAGAAAWDGETLELDTLEIALGRGRARLSGRVGDTLALRYELQALPLESLLAGLTGRATGAGEVAGSLEAPLLDGSLLLEEPGWDRYSAGRIAVDGNVTPSGERIALELSASALELAGVSIPSLELDVDGSLADHDLSIEAETGDATLRAVVAAGFADARWAGAVTEMTLVPADFPGWRLSRPADFLIAADEISLADGCLRAEDEAAEICAGFERRGGDYRLDAAFSDVPLAPFTAAAPAGITVEGSVRGRLEARLSGGVVNAEAGVTLEDTRLIARVDVEETREVVVSELRVQGTVTDNRLAASATLGLGEAGGGSAELSIADVLARDSALDGSLAVEFSDLELLSVLLPEIDDLTGSLRADVEARGTLAAPRIEGEAKLGDAGASVPLAGIRVTDLTLALTRAGPGVVAYEGSARSGDGIVRIEGRTRLAPEAGWPSELTVKGEGFELVKLPDFQATASPDLRIEADREAIVVGGTLTVPRARIALEEVPEGAAEPSPDAVVHGDVPLAAGGEESAPLELDLRVTLGEDVRLRGYGLTSGLEGTLRLAGGGNEPLLGYGQLDLRGGRYEAYGQELEIERGRLIFNGPLDNPALDIRAVRDTGEVLAGIRIRGTVEQPRSEVFSEPPLSQAQALSYLLTGRPLGAPGGADDDLLAGAAVSLGLSQAGSVLTRIGSGLGLDELGVEGGSGDGRVLAGKKIGPDLYVQYAYGIFDRIGSLLVRYQLSSRLALESRSGDDQSIDFIYRVGRPR